MPTLRLDKRLYPRAALRDAARAFGELARIDIDVDGASHRVRFRDVVPDVADRLADEFANYALARVVERSRGGAG